ncbi:MAG: hypothetical protein PHQ12_05155 [Chthoniobacteraceae bacterium]|nr:hypothetical protein [Chthoniobacteraceae bacterium]
MPVLRFAIFASVLWMAASLSAWGQQGVGIPYYNVKAGPVYFTLSSGITTEYTDNVNLANGTTTPIASELTVNPHFGIDAVSQLQMLALSESNVNTLSLRMNFGYRDYVFHPELNQSVTDVQIAPDSELAFLIRTGHVKIRLHDGFGLETDPPTDGSLSNVAQFRRFTNTFGADTHWDMNSITGFDLNYAHRNVYALDLVALGSSGTAANLNTSNYTNVSDMLTAMAQTKALSPWLTLGLRGSVQDMRYPQAPDQDSTTLSYGPFAALQLTDYTSLSASGGVTKSHNGTTFPDAQGDVAAGSDSSTQYADLSLNNRFNAYYTQTLSIGRETNRSVLGSEMDTNYVRYQSNWRVNSRITLVFGLFTDDTTDLGIAGAGGHYRLYGGSVSTGLQLSRKLNTSLAYRYLKKNCDDALESYQQNTVTWSLDYRF